MLRKKFNNPECYGNLSLTLYEENSVFLYIPRQGQTKDQNHDKIQIKFLRCFDGGIIKIGLEAPAEFIFSKQQSRTDTPGYTDTTSMPQGPAALP
jgi:hypothetical protein